MVSAIKLFHVSREPIGVEEPESGTPAKLVAANGHARPFQCDVLGMALWTDRPRLRNERRLVCMGRWDASACLFFRSGNSLFGVSKGSAKGNPAFVRFLHSESSLLYLFSLREMIDTPQVQAKKKCLFTSSCAPAGSQLHSCPFPGDEKGELITVYSDADDAKARTVKLPPRSILFHLLGQSVAQISLEAYELRLEMCALAALEEGRGTTRKRSEDKSSCVGSREKWRRRRAR